jgi:hypothetical protein
MTPIGKPAPDWTAAAYKDESSDSNQKRPCVENFYAQPFATQMLIWAMRRRLLNRAGAESGIDDVRHVFGMAGWGDLHDSLLVVVDAMIDTGTLRVHHVNCPVLARHERVLINSLAHLQRECWKAGRTCLRELLCPTVARVALRHLEAIALVVRAQGLRFEFVPAMSPPVWASPSDQWEKRNVH